MWELNSLGTSINKLDVNNTADDVGEWYINEELKITQKARTLKDAI